MTNPRAELRRQAEHLAGLGLPRIDLEPLEAQAAALEPSGEKGRIPFVLVVTWPPERRHELIARAELGGKPGFTTMEPDDLARFAPIDSVELPAGDPYLLADVDTGLETLNVTPDDALVAIEAGGRSPLTLDEGLALVLQHPEVLRERNCFSLLGSRCGDRRVTAIWLSERRPRLGWCWAGNPHTWLGSASCAARLGVAVSGRVRSTSTR